MKRVGTSKGRHDFEAQLPKKARHIARRVAIQQECVAPYVYDGGADDDADVYANDDVECDDDDCDDDDSDDDA